jgi:hypothetical protein
MEAVSLEVQHQVVVELMVSKFLVNSLEQVDLEGVVLPQV